MGHRFYSLDFFYDGVMENKKIFACKTSQQTNKQVNTLVKKIFAMASFNRFL